MNNDENGSKTRFFESVREMEGAPVRLGKEPRDRRGKGFGLFSTIERHYARVAEDMLSVR